MGCPARMDIPLMIRQIAAGQLEDAIATVKRDIALPATLGRICPAPCEKVCRRKQHDDAVSICLLKRHVADVDLFSDRPYSPAPAPKQAKRVAIVGAGPAGLAAAYYLQQEGFDCTIFDEHDEPGGMLRYAVTERNLPRNVLNAEIAQIQKLGVTFKLRTRVGIAVLLEEIREQFDAVFLATGELKAGDADALGIAVSCDGVKVDPKTGATSIPGVFAGGDVVRKRRLAVRAVADGKEAAQSIRQCLLGERVVGPVKRFNSRMGKLDEVEMELFLRSASRQPRSTPFRPIDGFTRDEAKAEALRCLRCDCGKSENCLLRRYAQAYDAKQTRYKADRGPFVKNTQHPDVIYEPGKCIDCGICIQTASSLGEKLGLSFVGRGFDVRVAVPFGDSLAEGLKIAAAECVKACPTGALAFKS
jgi:ferredoxin